MMSPIDSIVAVAGAQAGSLLTAASGMAATPNTSAPDAFASLLQREVSNLNADVGAAETAMRDLAAGKSVELHEVMISMERARLSVQTFLQIRNRLVESYQDLMRMQL